MKALDMDEEQRNREKAFLEFEINEIEEAALIPGEDETLEDRYRKLSNARRIMETAQMVRGMTGYEQGAADMTGNALKEFSRIADYDKDLAPLQEHPNHMKVQNGVSNKCKLLCAEAKALHWMYKTCAPFPASKYPPREYATVYQNPALLRQAI